ncbi:hypothetical protein JCM12298_11270 [Desulfothermus naphthae]
MIQLEKVSFRYNYKDVLRDISLTIKKEEIVGILGPNGSGKTTLLKVLSGILSPHSGKIFINKKPITQYKPRDRAKLIGFVPQYMPVYFPFTVYETILSGRFPYLGPFNILSKQDKEAVEKAIELTEIEHIADRKLTEISTGELQRVAIATCFAQDTEILLLDEPVSNLDINYQTKVLNILYSLNKTQKKTIVIVFHDINMAIRFCQRIFFLKKGKIVYEVDSPEKIREDIIEDIFDTSIILFESKTSKIFLPDILSQSKESLVSVIEEDKQITENYLIGGFIQEIKNAIQGPKMVLEKIIQEIPSNVDDSMEKVMRYLTIDKIDKSVSEDITKIVYNNSLLLKLKKQINVCLRALNRIMFLTYFINNYTKLKRDTSNITNLNEILLDIYESNFETLRKNKIKFNMEIEDNFILQINKEHLRSILENLILNSIDALEQNNTPNKEKTITVRCFIRKKRIFIQLEDNGPGIKEEEIRKIFIPFFTTKPEKRNGIGLFLVKRLVRLYGGRIYVHSHPGKLTTFHIVFPQNIYNLDETYKKYLPMVY